MGSEEILAIEERLIHLALDGDPTAAQEFADLNRLRRDWQRSESNEALQQLIAKLQTAREWVSSRS